MKLDATIVCRQINLTLSLEWLHSTLPALQDGLITTMHNRVKVDRVTEPRDRARASQLRFVAGNGQATVDNLAAGSHGSACNLCPSERRCVASCKLREMSQQLKINYMQIGWPINETHTNRGMEALTELINLPSAA